MNILALSNVSSTLGIAATIFAALSALALLSLTERCEMLRIIAIRAIGHIRGYIRRSPNPDDSDESLCPDINSC